MVYKKDTRALTFKNFSQMIVRGGAGGQEEGRSNKYKDIMQAAIQSSVQDETSIFEQLDLLTGHVTELVSRHDTHHMRRRRKEQVQFNCTLQ